jgi:oligoribonuclease
MGSDLPFLVWVDCEMTGLDTERDALVEIAVLITDAQLNVIGEGVDKVIRCDMNDVVRNMHQESGLLSEIPNGCTLEEADQAIYDYLSRYEVAPGKSPLAGNSVYMDRMFIARDLPKLNSFLHYRTIDVSTIKELARRWYPKTYFAAPAKEGNHRALGDIRDSIDELDYYRSTIFQK